MPVRDLIIKMYQAPDEVEQLIQRRRQSLVGDREWEPLAPPEPDSVPYIDRPSGALTPEFGDGVRTPDFGEEADLAREVVGAFGEGRVMKAFGAEWPRFPQ